MKKQLLFTIMLMVVIISGCSKEEITLNERFETYTNHWQEMKFDNMYAMHAENSKETYRTEDSVDRYQKIYEDLAISNIQIEYENLDEEALQNAMENETATIPFSISMNSIAGPISFDYEATLMLEGEEDDEKEWYIDWDPGFIFPQIKDGGEIRLQTVQPKRGEILDRNRIPLAMNDIVYEIGIIPERFVSEDEEKKQIANALNISEEAINEALNAAWVEPNLFVPIKRITTDQWTESLANIPSIDRKEVTGRVYPSGEAAAHLVGYIGPITAEELEEKEPGTYGPNDMIGKRGLEQLFEDQLKGEQGVTITVEKDGEETVLAEKEVQDGDNIYLTIDTIVQEKLYEAYEGEAGTAAAIHPKTGETLALVSSPSFNPNDIVYDSSTDLWNELENNEQKPLINRFTSTFAPGSVIKPITAAVGMQHGTLDPDEGLEIKGMTWSNGEGWGDYEVRRVSSTDHPVDLEDALIRSDNIYFAMQAVEMGSEGFVNGLKKFGLEEELPFDYPFTNSTISSDGTLSDEVQLANTSYGQGQIEVSSLHLALMYTPFLNEGNLLKPTLILDDEHSQVWKENVISPEQATLIQDILRKVVTDGTAQAANKEDLPISGKTGTAELKLTSDDEDGKENGWFVGYPTDDQDILISMMMEGVQDKGASSYVAEQVIEVFSQLK